ncbi:MAG TPA: aldehyde dehydrogenase family protein [Bacteroidales bacterium]|nr:aldehyde dehydrogenase family protein [Bacteroidales bacterium]HSA44896.1 aldehyde dehydrogenase family protein [Bacteroidales bacterium]
MNSPNINAGQILDQAVQAFQAFQELDQEQTDRIVRAVYKAGFNHRITLARMAWEETGIGKWEDKIIKNVIATRYVYLDIIRQRTVGIISEDEANGITEIAKPMGPVFAITPITNPTSTVLFKILICLKTRNPIIINPHGAARKCSLEAARICYEAALEAGAPPHCIQWIRRASREEVISMMEHRKTALILATGSVGLVRAAYRSGTPAYGVGPGNVPVYIGKSADVPFAVDTILSSKTFDNGTICASEQAVVVSKYNAAAVREAFIRRKAYFLDPQEIEKLNPVIFNPVERVMRAEVIGKPAAAIASMAGIGVPEGTSVLMAPLGDAVGPEHPFSMEILAPKLAWYEVDNFQQGMDMCRKINRHGGLGHTVSIFSNDPGKIRQFATVMNAGRIVVNTPSSQGALGGGYNTLQPSLTLACGSGGKNITTDNISVKHLLNIQRIAFRRENRCVVCDSDLYFNDSLGEEEVDRICRERYDQC